MYKFIGLICEIISVCIFSLIFGVGVGFIQGFLAWSEQKFSLKLGFAGFSAMTGGGVGLFIIPAIYFSLIRNSMSLTSFIEMNALVVLFGATTSYLLGYFWDAGWLSFLFTPVLLVTFAILYCKFNFSLTAFYECSINYIVDIISKIPPAKPGP